MMWLSARPAICSGSSTWQPAWVQVPQPGNLSEFRVPNLATWASSKSPTWEPAWVQGPQPCNQQLSPIFRFWTTVAILKALCQWDILYLEVFVLMQWSTKWNQKQLLCMGRDGGSGCGNSCLEFIKDLKSFFLIIIHHPGWCQGSIIDYSGSEKQNGKFSLISQSNLCSWIFISLWIFPKKHKLQRAL